MLNSLVEIQRLLVKKKNRHHRCCHGLPPLGSTHAALREFKLYVFSGVDMRIQRMCGDMFGTF